MYKTVEVKCSSNKQAKCALQQQIYTNFHNHGYNIYLENCNKKVRMRPENVCTPSYYYSVLFKSAIGFRRTSEIQKDFSFNSLGSNLETRKTLTYICVLKKFERRTILTIVPPVRSGALALASLAAPSVETL